MPYYHGMVAQFKLAMKIQLKVVFTKAQNQACFNYIYGSKTKFEYLKKKFRDTKIILESGKTASKMLDDTTSVEQFLSFIGNSRNRETFE